MYTEETTIKGWGSGICIGITSTIRDVVGLKAGTPIEVTVRGEEIIVKKINAKKSLFPFTEAELLADYAPPEYYADLLGSPLNTELVEYE
jgi:bifunctional DNA-binding transcriptional regulator/antitoxin component of YhaV-PrlF toxin-antitoxin module